jgi:formylglycine-generating enzyme required for sulfatase activity
MAFGASAGDESHATGGSVGGIPGRGNSGGTGGDAGSPPDGVGTAGVDQSGPCQGEGCSCAGLGESDCAGHSCCTSLTVPAGEFELGGGNAAVAGFRLDEFEVTVGRFRRYVEAYVGPPGVDSGQNDYVIGSGWMPEWSGEMPVNERELRKQLICEGRTWTDEAGEHEGLPMNCLTWFEAFAFCAWDGGRLPTEAEWEYAAAGGDQARAFPWGEEMPDASRALFGCEGSAGSCAPSGLLGVGSKPDGAARFGQLDLAGSLAEWTLDYFAAYPDACDHCANIGNGTERVARGGDLASEGPNELATTHRAAFDPQTRDFAHGVRCARPE